MDITGEICYSEAMNGTSDTKAQILRAFFRLRVDVATAMAECMYDEVEPKNILDRVLKLQIDLWSLYDRYTIHVGDEICGPHEAESVVWYLGEAAGMLDAATVWASELNLKYCYKVVECLARTGSRVSKALSGFLADAPPREAIAFSLTDRAERVDTQP